MAGSVVGRETELAAVDEVLVAAREGLRMLVVEGEAGIGKTTIWREGIERARERGYRVLSCHAAQAETRLSFAGLGDLLASVEPSLFAALPDPQRRGLDIALLRADADGAAPDPRTIGTGVVSLVAALAAQTPVLIAVDDAQWLDRPTARALEFALRRLETYPVVVLTTVRLGDASVEDALPAAVPADRLRRARLGPLSMGSLYEILKDRLGETLTRPLLGNIERVSRGNPFYAKELARALQADGLPSSGEALPIPDDTRQLVGRRIRRLPRRTRDELVKVSAMSRPTVGLVDPDLLGPAVEAGVLSVQSDGRVEFTHPLFAGAVYAGASRDHRRMVHLELSAEVTDPEEQARHRSLATDGPDERVADLLDEAALHAYARGACEAAAELEEQAAGRTPVAVADLAAERLFRAARHQLKAGNRARARVLSEAVIAAVPAPAVRAKALHLLAEITIVENAPASIPLLVEALEYVGDDASLAANIELSLGFTYAATLADTASAEPHLVRAMALAENSGEGALLAEVTLFWIVSKFLSGHGLDEADLERALALEDPDREVPFQLRPSLNVGMMYMYLGRLDVARRLLTKLRGRIVARGEDSDLPYVLSILAGAAWLAGELGTAEDESTEALRVATLTGQDVFRSFALFDRAMARAIGGNHAGSGVDAAEALAIAEGIGWYHGVAQARWTQAFVALSEGDPERALVILEPVVAAVEGMGVYEWPLAMSIPDTIEAMVATGRLDDAERPTDAMAAWGLRFDRPWALALSGRSRALLEAARGQLDAAALAAERAIVAHQRLPVPFELGRTLLVLGQIQRRQGKRRAARLSLEAALATFERVGATVWAERARTEARRMGVRRAPAGLTETEQSVAQLAATGLTNPQIASQLFVSRRTVEANLARAYSKLGIRSRAELGAVMSRREAVPPS
jgi:DNA-binding CsgD family transcriptional regulator